MGVAAKTLVKGPCRLCWTVYGTNVLLLVDAHTKWMDIHIVPSTTLLSTIEKMRKTFATLSLPEMLVTDNGSVFTSSEFADFVKRNGIFHITSSPYHLSSNGLVEHAVQIMKDGLKKFVSGSLEMKLAWFLFKYQLTPQSWEFHQPSSCLADDFVHNLQAKVQSHQEQQKFDHDHHARSREFKCGDLVHVRNFSQGPMWIPGVVIQVQGPMLYTVELPNGELKCRHVSTTSTLEWNQMLLRSQTGLMLFRAGQLRQLLHSPMFFQMTSLMEMRLLLLP